MRFKNTNTSVCQTDRHVAVAKTALCYAMCRAGKKSGKVSFSRFDPFYFKLLEANFFHHVLHYVAVYVLLMAERLCASC